MAIDRDRGAGSYGPQPGGGRMGTGSREFSLEAALASFETTLGQHSNMIEKMAGKVDDMDKTLAGVKIQMQHLVTKESCAEGRKELADDLKARMDGEREITGVGITVPEMWQRYAETMRASGSSAGQASTTPPTSKSRAATSTTPPPRSAGYYLRTISSVVSLVFAIITITFFAYKMVDRMDRQQAVMQEIQRNIKQIETRPTSARSASAPELEPVPGDDR